MGSRAGGGCIYTVFEDGRVVGYIVFSFEKVDEVEIFLYELFFLLTLRALVLSL